MIQLDTLRTLADWHSDAEVRGHCKDALSALEVSYRDKRVARLEIMEVMRRESDGSRPMIPHAPSSIAAGEVRASKRTSVRRSDEYIAANGARVATSEPSYLETSRDAGRHSRASKHFKSCFDADCYSIKGLPLWLTLAFDTETIERTWPGHVTVMEAPETARKTTRRAVKTASRDESRIAAGLRAAGTIRMAEQD